MALPAVQEDTKVGAAAAVAEKDKPAEKAAPAPASKDEQPVDVEALKAQHEQAVRDLAVKHERDIDNLRSSVDRDAAERVRKANERLSQAERERDEFATKGMDDAQRNAYERDRALEREQAANQRNAELTQALEQNQEFNNALAIFRQKGIPDADLDMAHGVEGLASSAWEYLEKKANGASEAKPTEEPVKTDAPKKKALKAPDVITSGQAPSGGGKTMADLIKEYAEPNEHPEATERRIYESIGNGDLPASILPIEQN